MVSFVVFALVLGVVPPAEPQLITLVLVDALRPDHLGSYGYARPTSPHMDALAARGTRFLRAYVNAPWTRPSTASFLTGQNASRHRTETAQSKLPRDITTLAERLHAQGFITAGFVANGNGGSLAGLERGFDVFHDPTHTYSKDNRGVTYNGLPSGPFVVTDALTWLRKQPRSARVFLFLFLVDPHDPYGAPPNYEELFLMGYRGNIPRRPLWERDNAYSKEERRAMIAIYDAGIRHADDAIGKLWNGIGDLGWEQHTHLFLSADHGEGFGEHGFYLHAHHFWDEVIRVPLLAVGPRFSQAKDSRLVQSIDVTATILELALVSAPELLGTSLLAAPKPGRTLISEYNEFGIHRQAIIGERYKVIWQTPADESVFLREVKRKDYFPSVSFDREVVQVYDLLTDPDEKHDLSAQMPEAAAAALAELRAFVMDAR